MTVEERRRRRFSEEFRRRQVELIESGELTISDVSRLYEVKRASIKRWLQKFGKKELPSKILISMDSEIDRMKSLENEVRKLKEIIGEQQIKIITQQSLITLAEERLGKDFEKK